jgi:2,3-bisphosphoglycerate-dependent phosphoglycerate mutase
MRKLILLRHGASAWNEKNLFTGWVDIPLSSKGIQEALEAGKKIGSIPIDAVFASTLVRGQMTALLALSSHPDAKVARIVHPEEKRDHIFSAETEKMTIPVFTAWELNERMYGELQGMNKQEMCAKFGEEQVQIWRRSYDVPPPGGESLKMTAERTLPYFHTKIMPELKKGKNVLVVAHGNSLRSIIMALDHLTPEEVVELEIPTGLPLIYTYDHDILRRDV